MTARGSEEQGRRFSVASFADDWAGPGRKIKASTDDSFGSLRHRGTVTLDSGWFFSAIWGDGSYTTNSRMAPGEYIRRPSSVSRDAEVMPYTPTNDNLDLKGDTVAGWVSPEMFEEALRAAEKDDEAGVVAALTREDDSDA